MRMLRTVFVKVWRVRVLVRVRVMVNTYIVLLASNMVWHW